VGTVIENHFQDEEWTDFVRSTASVELRNRVHEHLESKCAQCEETLATWNSVAELAKRELAYEVPATVVRSLKACFTLRKQVPVLLRVADMAKLILDSFRDPLPAGVRGGALSNRRLLHEAGCYYIDISLERRESGRVRVTGQIVSRDGQPGLTGGTCVLFLKGETHVLSQTIANSNDEFQQEIDDGKDLRIFLQILDTRIVCIELPDLAQSDSRIE
jgi:hypothetical protein